MRRNLVVGLVAAFILSLLSAAPASAAVRVIVRANGDVVINGDAADNDFYLELCGDGTGVLGFGEGSDIEPLVIPLVDDVTFNLKGGNDRATVVGGEFASCTPLSADGGEASNVVPEIPGNLKFVGGSGNDRVDVAGLSIGKDLTGSLGSGDNSLSLYEVQVGDDLTLRASSGNDIFEAHFYDIHDRMDVNLGAGNNQSGLGSGSTARAIIRGHNGDDRLRSLNEAASLGHNPIIILAGGADLVDLVAFDWTGKMRVNTGGGSDNITFQLGFGRTAGSPFLDVDTGSGDDTLTVVAALVVADDFNGGPGDDVFRYLFAADSGATINNFETELDI